MAQRMTPRNRMKASPLNTILRFVALLFKTTACVAADAPADEISEFAKRLFAVRTISEVAIAPDGRRVAWVESLPTDPGTFPTGTAIWVAERVDSRNRVRVSAGKDAEEHGITWAPDSCSLAFLSNTDGATQVYSSSLNGRPPRRLTDTGGFLRGLRFSANGRTLAVLHTGSVAHDSGPTKPHPRDVGVIGESLDPQRLALVDLNGGGLHEISSPQFHVYEFDPSPDGKQFAIIAAPPPGNANWWVAGLSVMDASGGNSKLLYSPELQIAVPRFSPDGKHVAIVHGLMSDEDSPGGEIVLVATDGQRSTTHTLESGRPTSVSWLAWSATGDLLWGEHDRGGVAISRARCTNGTLAASQTLWRGDEMLRADTKVQPSFSVAHDGITLAMTREAFDLAPEVWAGELGDWRQLTEENTAAKVEWGAARSITWTCDGGDRQGWLLEPLGYNQTQNKGSFPLAVWVHGGPANQVTPRWPSAWTLARAIALSHRGYFVFFPNVRGSYGRGAAFSQANVKDFGGGDLRDLLAGVDCVVRDWPIDSERLAIAGWSYGGFFTMWTVTQTQRFRAAMAGAGIANWQSYYGQNSISTWMTPFFGASVYDDPAVYAKCSPMNFIKQVKTPTLLLVGERDAEVPSPQSFEFWRALRVLGVPSQLVVYPDEGHTISSYEHRVDLMQRITDWFNHHLTPESRRERNSP